MLDSAGRSLDELGYKMVPLKRGSKSWERHRGLAEWSECGPGSREPPAFSFEFCLQLAECLPASHIFPSVSISPFIKWG